METDHEALHRELENEGDELEQRRNDLASETDTARQDLNTKISDNSTPGVQDRQEDVLGGKDAVERAEAGDDESEEAPDEAEVGGSEGAGYRE
ncbi:MAG: hypothetical protein AVDCRST_MAG17-1880 [uncultured Solirubrobacterales bacterium]|uniref:Uncharacterized protein n=1 Tax=uncultured Solirubrobacterales bacterium TaxID=768556 RepID=A0A6J4SZ29_9ACTN|nr:MAG: hypothetical protein AVDCRST_MAG17-1880 [uncultured Solirubrobacterales bacterium]